jgi:two-component system sensor histidine kinase/response regulator
MATQLMTHTNPQAYKVLVVDDNPMNLKVVTNYLGKEIGFQMLTARNGRSGIERARHGHPDLVLLDVLMPEMDGFETCRRLKATSDTKDIPIIFMTALSDTEHKVKGFEAGAVDYVTKPIQQREVLARVVTHLRICDLTQHLEMLVAARTKALQASLQREQYLAQQLQQALDKEVELNAHKSQLIEVVSHEFGTPLTVIAQATALIHHHFERLSTDQRQRQFDKVNDSIRFISRLIKDVSFTINLPDIAINQTPVDFQMFCHTLKSGLTAAFAESNRLAFVCESGPSVIVTDMLRVQQIVSNLVSNALKFSQDEVRIHITKRASAAVISVQDSGIGISGVEQAKIFDLFSRASNAEAYRGLGLGLYIARQLTEKMNGRLRVESEGVNQGCTFALQLP